MRHAFRPLIILALLLLLLLVLLLLFAPCRARTSNMRVTYDRPANRPTSLVIIDEIVHGRSRVRRKGEKLEALVCSVMSLTSLKK